MLDSKRTQLHPRARKYVPTFVTSLHGHVVCDTPVGEIRVKHEHYLMARLATVGKEVLKHTQEAYRVNRLTSLLTDLPNYRRLGSLAEFNFSAERTVEHFSCCRIGCPEHEDSVALSENTQRCGPY